MAENGHIIAQINGANAWKYFKYETGKHVIQRVPPTETKGRKQTSVVSVAILPLPPENTTKSLPSNELEIIAQCGHGPGGQHQNKSATSVRIKHLPTGLSVFIVGRSFEQNKTRALKIINAKVSDQFISNSENNYNYLRKQALGNGSRGNKIRTYNLIEHRLTDHRTNVKIHNVDKIFKNGSFELFN